MRIVWVLGGAAAFFGCFLISLFVTFPDDAIEQRLRHEVRQATGESIDLSVGGVSPWWAGLRMRDVSVKALSKDGDEATLLAQLPQVRARGALGSLMAQTPAVDGALVFQQGQVDFSFETAMNKRGSRLELTGLNVEATDVAVSEVLGLMGQTIDVDGLLSLLVDVEGEGGMRESDGRITFTARDLVVRSLGDAMPALGFDIPIDEVEVRAEVREGRANLRRGRIRGEMFEGNIEGEIHLREEVARSSFRLNLVIQRLTLPEGMGAFVEAGMKDAKWSDGTYRYQCNGTFDRFRGCQAVQDRSSRRGSSRSSANVPPAQQPGGTRPPTSGTARSTNQDRSRDVDEIRDRLKQRREQRDVRQQRRSQDLDELEDAKEELGYEDDELEEIGYEDDGVDELFGDEVPLEDFEDFFND